MTTTTIHTLTPEQREVLQMMANDGGYHGAAAEAALSVIASQAAALETAEKSATYNEKLAEDRLYASYEQAAKLTAAEARAAAAEGEAGRLREALFLLHISSDRVASRQPAAQSTTTEDALMWEAFYSAVRRAGLVLAAEHARKALALPAAPAEPPAERCICGRLRSEHTPERGCVELFRDGLSAKCKCGAPIDAEYVATFHAAQDRAGRPRSAIKVCAVCLCEKLGLTAPTKDGG